MKTNKLIYVIAVVGFSLFFILNSCGNEIGKDGFPQSGETITQYEWKVQSIVFESKHLKTPSDHTLREEAYILKFDNDSYFSMATSVNYAGGKYQIVSEGSIIIEDYHEGTKVYNALDQVRDFDDRLLSAFNGVTSYSCSGDKLSFRGDKIEVDFVKVK
jgi:hypothetical protein